MSEKIENTFFAMGLILLIVASMLCYELYRLKKLETKFEALTERHYVLSKKYNQTIDYYSELHGAYEFLSDQVDELISNKRSLNR